MDQLIGLAFNLVLQLLEDKQKLTKFASVLAKVYVKIANAAMLNQTLKNAIESRGGRL